MEGDIEAASSTEDETKTNGDRSRQRSKIQFPYADLSAALAVANAIHGHAGTGDCSLQQLSAWMDQSIKSSGFRVQLSATRLFGIIESDGTEAYRLAPLGRQIVDPRTVRKAKSDAFLNVPLFQKLFDNYGEGVLPPAAALEREINNLGVADKQKDRARQIFERSAEQAGFFEHGRNRLVMPAIKDGGRESTGGSSETGNGGGGGGNEPPKIDTIIQGLIDRLPKAGSVWKKRERELWIQILKSTFDLVYVDEDENTTKDRISGGQNAN